MSELESKRASLSTAQPISTAALQKLKSISGNGSVFASADGLVDAFSEVFARMAAATPQATPSASQSSTDSAAASDSKSTSDAESNNVENVENDSDSADAPVEVVAANQGSESLFETVQTNVDRPNSDQGQSNGEEETSDDLSDSVAIAAAVGANQEAVKPNNDPSIGSETEPQSADDQNILHPQKLEKTGKPSDNTGDVAPPIDSVGDDNPAAPRTEPGVTSEQTSTEMMVGGTTDVEADTGDSPRHQRKGHRDNQHATDPSAKVNSNVQTDEQIGKNTGSIAIPESILAESAAANVIGGTTESQSEKLLQSIQQTVTAAAAATATPNATTANGTVPAVRGGGSTDASATFRVDSMTAPAGAKAEAAAKSKAAASSESSNTDILTRIKLIQRVSKAFQHLGPEGGVVRLRLAPAELGTVRVEMRIQQKKVEARVVTNTEAASAALKEHLPELRARLESFGMSVESIEVETDTSFDQNDSSAFTDQESSWGQQPRRSPDRPQRPSRVSPTVSQPVSAPVAVGTAISGGVDVRL
ncbi:flagellar hook-length control protein FliK [Rubripirellula reticaptiva]|uniref:Flagellar hook-length control protein FliK n=1 Tax=Rubripirellula reticaptiva TaxID=2528013 RepID=A0A5C6FD49_9BACT|nr:flagellar hook-length control protein FliK [Rubripirellula reticaptiva]TWU57521.1 Flagellar hook-length control protein FliK [Rubripirellula reticaptiva]